MDDGLYVCIRVSTGGLDRTCEIKHAGSNLMLMKNALLSLMSSIQGTYSGYTLFKKDCNTFKIEYYASPLF